MSRNDRRACLWIGVIGTLFVVHFGVLFYAAHKHDQEFSRLRTLDKSTP